MNTTNTEITVCSNAIMLLGGQPIQSFDDAGAGALLAKSLFPNIYKTFLSSSNWNFATKQFELAQLVDQPLNTDFKYMYQLPNDVLRINGIHPNSNYAIELDKLLTNENKITIEYQSLIPVQNLPAFAVETLQYLVAANLAIPLTNDSKKAELWYGMSKRSLIQSRFIDSQNDPNTSGIEDYTLVNVRY